MEQIKAAFRDAGIIIPLSHNEKGQRSISWSTDYQNVGGAVNVYGLDSCKYIIRYDLLFGLVTSSIFVLQLIPSFRPRWLIMYQS